MQWRVYQKNQRKGEEEFVVSSLLICPNDHQINKKRYALVAILDFYQGSIDCSVIAHPIFTKERPEKSSTSEKVTTTSTLLGVMEFVKVNGNFNEEDEEIVESMESNLTKVENLSF